MIKKYKWILVWAILSVLIAFFIHFCFKIDAPNEFWVASWSSGEILTYISTIALGLLAFYQNQTITQKSLEREKYVFAIEHNALFDFGDISATYIDEHGNESNANVADSGFNGNKAIWKLYSSMGMSKLKLEISIENIGVCTATNLRITDNNGNKIDKTNILHDINGKNDKKYIKNGSSGIVIICVDLKNLNQSNQLEYFLTFTNPFGDEFSQKIIVTNTINSLIQIDTQCTLNI